MRLQAAFVALLLVAGPASAADLKDDFESGKVDPSKWTSEEIFPRQESWVKPGRCGEAAIEVSVFDGDDGIQCTDDCQRAELRTAKSYWPKFGDEVWFEFSFRIVGSVPPTGSTRTVIGQWKGPGDDSPMIAQRFDNNVFHITVQDNETRRVVAKAEGDPDALVAAQKLLATLDPKNTQTVASIRLLQSLDQTFKAQPGLTEKLLKQDFSHALKSDDDAKASQALASDLHLGNADVLTQFKALSFVSEPEKYLGKADITINPQDNRQLPDPRKGWVDMVYRIKPGRTDNEYGPTAQGEIDIWANGEKIVSVRGNIGATLKKNDPHPLVGPYFKFGTYRLRVANKFSFDFDEFSQASSQAGLSKVCAATGR